MELGSILSAIGAAFATVRAIAGLIRDRSEAKTDILKAEEELRALRSVLDPRQSTKNGYSPRMGVEEATNRCIKIISAIETLLENHKNKKTRWALDGKVRLAELEKTLEASKTALTLYRLDSLEKKVDAMIDLQTVPKTGKKRETPNGAAGSTRNKPSLKHNPAKPQQEHIKVTGNIPPRQRLAKERLVRSPAANRVRLPQGTDKPQMPRGTKAPGVGSAKRRSQSAQTPRKTASSTAKLQFHERAPMPPSGRIPKTTNGAVKNVARAVSSPSASKPAKPTATAKPTASSKPTNSSKSSAPARPVNVAKTKALPVTISPPSPTSSPKLEGHSSSLVRRASWRFTKAADNLCAPEKGAALFPYVEKCEIPTSGEDEDWFSNGFSGEGEERLHEGFYDDHILNNDTPSSNDALKRQVDAEHNERQPREPEGSLCSNCRNSSYSVELQMPHCNKWLCLECISSKFTKATQEPYPWPKCCWNGDFLPPSWATLLDIRTKEEFNNIWCRRMVHCPLSECGFVDKFYVLRDEPMVRCRQCMHQIYLVWGDESHVSACHDDDTGPIEDVFEI